MISRFFKGDKMNFWKKIFTAAVLAAVLPQTAEAVVDFNPNRQQKTVGYTSFMDYPPFGVYNIRKLGYGQSRAEYASIFTNMINDFFQTNSLHPEFIGSTDYSDLVRRVRAGDVDIIFGIYYGTKIYDGLDYVMPAIIDNPVTIIMLPERVGEIKQLSDLKNSKAGVLPTTGSATMLTASLKSLICRANPTLRKCSKNFTTKKLIISLPAIILGLSKLPNSALGANSAFLNRRFGICRCSSGFQRRQNIMTR